MAKKTLTYQEAFVELEDILEKMERNELGIDQLSDQVKRASELIVFCKSKLKATEKEVQEILTQIED